jgi:hypothetical protein
LIVTNRSQGYWPISLEQCEICNRLHRGRQ